MIEALAFLKQLTIVLPPPTGAHSLIIGPDNKLQVNVRVPKGQQTFFLDPDDMLETPKVLALRISGLADMTK